MYLFNSLFQILVLFPNSRILYSFFKSRWLSFKKIVDMTTLDNKWYISFVPWYPIDNSTLHIGLCPDNMVRKYPNTLMSIQNF